MPDVINKAKYYFEVTRRSLEHSISVYFAALSGTTIPLFWFALREHPIVRKFI